MFGLVKGAVAQEVVVRVDESQAIRYRVVRERIDLQKLRQERDDLERLLDEKQPTDAELVELGRWQHPFYLFDKEAVEKQLAQIDQILGR